jgi:hypothetical protein
VFVVGALLASLPIATRPAAAAAIGQVYAFGSAADLGAPGNINQAVVGMASTPSGDGYWVTAADGGVFAYGDAGFFGSAGDIRLNRPIVGMAATPSGRGYWFVATDGGVFAYGDARFFGSTGAVVLNKPIVGMAATPSGNGYWLVASDGGIFAYGDARFFGSTGAIVLNKPIVGMAATPSGNGYWLVASDGGVFAYGDAGFFGSTGSIALQSPIVGMAASLSGRGYWFVASDGGLFAYGDAPFEGSLGADPLLGPIVAMARPTARGDGYWLLANGDDCIGDPAAEDVDSATYPEIDLVRVCLHATAAGLVVDMTMRRGLSRAELMARMGNYQFENNDPLGFALTLGDSIDSGRYLIGFVGDGADMTAQVYFLDTPNEQPRIVRVGLAINGPTYSFGPIAYGDIAGMPRTYYFGAEANYSDIAWDLAPEFDGLVGPVPGPRR